MISNYEVAQKNATFLRVVGNIGRIVKNDSPNPHKKPSTSLSMCHIYHQRSERKNARNDEKCGTKTHMPNKKYAMISPEKTCNSDIIRHIVQDKISAKRILIIHYFWTWYETISLIKDQPIFKIKLSFKLPTKFSTRH